MLEAVELVDDDVVVTVELVLLVVVDVELELFEPPPHAVSPMSELRMKIKDRDLVVIIKMSLKHSRLYY